MKHETIDYQTSTVKYLKVMGTFDVYQRKNKLEWVKVILVIKKYKKNIYIYTIKKDFTELVPSWAKALNRLFRFARSFPRILVFVSP
jgi:hypothetical protein